MPGMLVIITVATVTASALSMVILSTFAKGKISGSKTLWDTVTTGKCLIGIDLRLDQQVHAEADHVGDQEPRQAQHALGHQHQPALAAAEAEPFVDGVQQPLQRLQHVAEQVHHQVEQAGQNP